MKQKFLMSSDDDDNMRGWDPASEDDSKDNGMGRWCSNVTQPDLQTLDKIAKLLDVDVKELLNSTEKKVQ